MKFGDYFTKDFETNESHYIPTLKTRYYRNRKEDVKKAIGELAKARGGKIVDDNDTYGELLFETPAYNCIVTLTNPRSMSETAVDLKVTANGIFGKGKKAIEEIYKELDKKLSFVASGSLKG